MTLKTNDIEQAIASVKKALADEPNLSPALAGALETLLLLVSLLLSRLGLDSQNSSTPPSGDPNRAKTSRRGRSTRRPGGQPGHTGTTLRPVDDPDVIVDLPLDRRTLPTGRRWRSDGFETRQVFDVVLRREVTEYRAEVWIDDTGQRHVAAFPEHASARVQYGRMARRARPTRSICPRASCCRTSACAKRSPINSACRCRPAHWPTSTAKPSSG